MEKLTSSGVLTRQTLICFAITHEFYNMIYAYELRCNWLSLTVISSCAKKLAHW